MFSYLSIKIDSKPIVWDYYVAAQHHLQHRYNTKTGGGGDKTIACLAHVYNKFCTTSLMEMSLYCENCSVMMNNSSLR